ncbi:hypothetical protein C4D60_Mb10t00700 [Musa balbisiana]|uniref:VAN3-binding protein-like auxin canalisation domain-containing protein n=1 Tax=Musa balbisiana TaxID=52838 RepID=A0A4S8IV19_MUSBA|nr:hypothetical protein C4D60_Mb10t00700 [Musa balbisiana]
MGSREQMDLLSHAWCNSAIQVFQPSVDACPNAFKERQIVAFENDKMRAEVHAAISVAGVAAALAAIAAENLEANQHKSLRDTAVASAAALVAAQCAQVAEAAGAKREQISSAIDAAATATDAANIFTLTAAAATCTTTQ